MLHFHSFMFNPFQENTYIVWSPDGEAVVIDPGMYDPDEVNELFVFLEDKQLSVRSIYLTHAHLDHIFGLRSLHEKYTPEVYLHQQDMMIWKNAEMTASVYGMQLRLPGIEPLHYTSGVVPVGGEELKVFHTPGHSPGSVSFYYDPGKWIIGGDVLFQMSVGRTDLPGGNFETLIHSIQTHFFTLSDDTKVLSGHGPSTTIAFEKQNNPFLTSR